MINNFLLAAEPFNQTELDNAVTNWKTAWNNFAGGGADIAYFLLWFAPLLMIILGLLKATRMDVVLWEIVQDLLSFPFFGRVEAPQAGIQPDSQNPLVQTIAMAPQQNERISPLRPYQAPLRCHFCDKVLTSGNTNIESYELRTDSDGIRYTVCTECLSGFDDREQEDIITEAKAHASLPNRHPCIKIKKKERILRLGGTNDRT